MTTLTDEQIAAQAKSELDAGIEQLYTVFAKYELKEHVVGCPCCVSDEDNVRIHSKLLRELTSDDLDKYAFKAMTTWGEAEDFKHFLPRLFEIIAFEHFGLVTPDLLFRKIRFAELMGTGGEWTEQEMASIEKYLQAFWHYEMSIEHDTYAPTADYLEVQRLLEGIGSVVDNLLWYLEEWQEHSSLKASATLSAFFSKHLDYLERNGYFKHFGLPDAPLETITTWLNDKTTLQTLIDKLASETDEEKKSYIAKSVELLELFQDLQTT